MRIRIHICKDEKQADALIDVLDDLAPNKNVKFEKIKERQMMIYDQTNADGPTSLSMNRVMVVYDYDSPAKD